MNEQIINEIVEALPDEGLDELEVMLDREEYDEGKIRDLLVKYNVNVTEILANKEVK